MSIYELDLEFAKKKILDSKAKRVLIQLPDGIKPRAKEIVEELQDLEQKKKEMKRKQKEIEEEEILKKLREMEKFL